jgi:PAS domain S-box-containing protein
VEKKSLQLSQSRADKFNIIFDQAPVLIFCLDRYHRCTLWNHECEKRLGWQFTEVRECEDLLSLLFSNINHKVRLEKSLTDNPGRFLEYRLRTKNSKYRYQLWAGFQISNNEQMFIGLDITESKKTEKAYKSFQRQLRNLSAYLESVKEQERARISRDIHDELGQMLSLLQIELKWLYDRISKDQTLLIDKIHSMSRLIDSIVEWVRKISQELRPNILDNLGIGAATEWLVDEFRKQTGFACTAKISPADMILENELSTAVFRIIQEALTNVMRHSQASHVEVRLFKRKEGLRLKISDNGIGLSKKKMTNPKSLGLIGMKERVRFFNGKFKIESRPDKGTTLSVQLPFEKEN